MIDRRQNNVIRCISYQSTPFKLARFVNLVLIFRAAKHDSLMLTDWINRAYKMSDGHRLWTDRQTSYWHNLVEKEFLRKRKKVLTTRALTKSIRHRNS